MTQFDQEEMKRDNVPGDWYHIVKGEGLSWAARDSFGMGFNLHVGFDTRFLLIDKLRVSRNMARSLINVLETWLEEGKKNNEQE